MINGMKVLMIEDNPADELLIKRVVMKAFPDSRLLCVEDREPYIEALETFRPDIILSDYSLPRFDGMTALKLAIERVPDIPFVIVTGSINEETAAECILSGAWDYVLKDHLTRLSAAILRALEQQTLRIERRMALQALHESEERYRNIIDVAPIGIAVYSDVGIEFINPMGLKLLGTDDINQIIGKTISEIVSPESEPIARDRVKRLLAGEKGLYPVEDIYLKLDGTPIQVEIMATTILYNDKPAIQVIVSDISERKKAEQERKKADETNVYLSYHDHLTQLHNRRYFENTMKAMCDKRLLPLTIIMGDVNGLKLINDSFGHDAGDELLIKAAQVIRKCCRDEDVVARIGGDEFGMLLPKTDETSAEKIIKRIKEEAAAVEFDNTLLSVSFGFCTMHNFSRRIEEAMMDAENYMYRRKMYESASMRNKTIDVIMNALYEKSTREMLHSKRVSTLCARIAEELGFQMDEINKIRMSGLVHDIGKIGITEKILNKEGKLDDDEWLKIKKHPEAGWRILSSAKEFSDLAKHILYHHERWDGTGYPEGLEGVAIPIEARIISVADAFDAMTTARPYRGAMELEKIIDEFKRCSGQQFDPRIVDVFLDNVLKDSKVYEC